MCQFLKLAFEYFSCCWGCTILDRTLWCCALNLVEPLFQFWIPLSTLHSTSAAIVPSSPTISVFSWTPSSWCCCPLVATFITTFFCFLSITNMSGQLGCLSVWNSKSHRILVLWFSTTFDFVSHQDLVTSSPHVAQMHLHTTPANLLFLSLYTVTTCICITLCVGQSLGHLFTLSNLGPVSCGRLMPLWLVTRASSCTAITRAYVLFFRPHISSLWQEFLMSATSWHQDIGGGGQYLHTIQLILSIPLSATHRTSGTGQLFWKSIHLSAFTRILTWVTSHS